MICKNCGSVIPENSRFCSVCGAPVQAEAEAPFIPEQPAAPAVPPYPSDTQTHSAPYAPAQNAPYSQPGAYASQPAYANPAYVPDKTTNGLAIAGFVCSLVGVVVPYFGVPIEIIAFILSCIGVGQAKKRGEKGRGLAIAGIVISLFVLLAAILIVVFLVYLLRAYAPDFYHQFEQLIPYFSQYLA